MMKKILALTIAVVMTAGRTVSAANFTDVNNHWAKDYIVSLADSGVVDGVTDTEFMPEESVTRAQYLKMIMEAVGVRTKPVRNGECLDATDSDWYGIYLQGALDASLIPKAMIADYSENVDYSVDGDGKAVYTKVTYKGSFNADTPVTREEMAVLTQYMYQYTRSILTNRKIDEKKKVQFADEKDISEFAETSVYQAVVNGFMDGMDNNMFRPSETATRAQAATVIWRVINK